MSGKSKDGVARRDCKLCWGRGKMKRVGARKKELCRCLRALMPVTTPDGQPLRVVARKVFGRYFG